MDGISWCFESLDKVRRLHGQVFDGLGLGPGERAHRSVFARPSLRLRRYGASMPGRQAMLIVPAPIKRFYIWDLSAQRSVVRQALARGFEVYLCEWTEPDGRLGLDDYVARLLGQCVAAIAHNTGKV